MNNIILHISDLHISDHSDGYNKSYDDTFIKTTDDELNYSFITSFIEFVKSHKYQKIFLIITGDITNCGEQSEFEIAEKYISMIIDSLKISISEVLIIPGDHDVNRKVLRSFSEERGLDDNDANTLQDEKFSYFNTFYKSIKGVDFNSKKFIFDFINTEDILLLGVNSNYKIGLKGGTGFLPVELFEKELKEIKLTNRTKELIICMHHNIHGEHEDKQSGQWDLTNRRNLIPVFQRNSVKCILNGNEHTPNSKILDSTDIVVSDSGPLTCIKTPNGSFKIYEINKDTTGLYLKNNLFKLIQNGSANNTVFGHWSQISFNGQEQGKFILKERSTPLTEPPVDLPTPEEDDSFLTNYPNTQNAETLNSVYQDIYSNSEIQKKLYTIIKDKGLFHQGHYHWSATSRAHNWIDISRLLEDREDLFFIKNAVIDVIESKTQTDFDLMIGLGYEGNIISTKASIKYDVPYVFLPYSYRYKDHHEFENKLNYDNSEKKFKKVLIITDVVNDGRTIRKLVGKETREKSFFDNVEEIVVISLFYTGVNKKTNSNILNYSQLPESYDKHNDHEVNNIKFYFIKSLQVEKCPYGDNYKSECLIYKDDLNCVHKFYTEES